MRPIAVLVWLGALAVGCGPEPFLSGREPGDPCTYSNDCRSGLCLDLGHPSGVGVCTIPCGGSSCTLSGDARDPIDGICSSGICVPSEDGPGTELEPCGVVGPAWFGSCSAGLVCADWPDWLPTCSRRCFAASDCGGTDCLPTSSPGVSICSLYR